MKQLKQLWDKAGATGEAIDIGGIVVCDVCNDDYTNSDATGGFIFGSYAYCPTCAKRHLAEIVGFGEESYIRARCPELATFADFVRAYRGPSGNTIQIRSRR